MIRLENEIEKSLLEASDSIISETSLNNSDFVKNNNLTKITKSNKVIMKFVKLWEASYIIYIFPIHTFVNIPALLLKNTTRFLIRAGIYRGGNIAEFAENLRNLAKNFRYDTTGIEITSISSKLSI